MSEPTFKPGDKVRCVERTGRLTEGAVYTVRWCDSDEEGDEMVKLEETGYTKWLAYRFELVGRASSDPLGDAIRRAARGEDSKPPKEPYEPESFVGRDDIDWLKLIKDGST